MIFFASVYSQLIFHWKDRSLVIKQNHSTCAKVMGSKWIQNRPRCAVLVFMVQISCNAAKLCFSDSSSLVTSCVFTDKKELDTWPINLSFQIKLAKKTYFNQHSSHPRLILCESLQSVIYSVLYHFSSSCEKRLHVAEIWWKLWTAHFSFTAWKLIFRSSESISI